MQPWVWFTWPMWESTLGRDEPQKNFTPNTAHLSTDEKAWPGQTLAQHLTAHSNAKFNSEILSVSQEHSN